MASVFLVIVTIIYTNEARLSRKSQEEGFDKYIEELQKSRRQQLKPYVYVFFYNGGSKFYDTFYIVLKNFGSGPAFDIEYSYSAISDDGNPISHNDKCPAWGSGMEKLASTSFSSAPLNFTKNKVKVEITYKDSFFDKTFTDTFEYSLKELKQNPIPCDSANLIRMLVMDEVKKKI